MHVQGKMEAGAGDFLLAMVCALSRSQALEEVDYPQPSLLVLLGRIASDGDLSLLLDVVLDVALGHVDPPVMLHWAMQILL